MMIRDRLGRFELRSELGRGGFADVYLAFDPERGEEVALKVYRLSLADPEALEAEKRGVELQKELAAVAPQVARIHDFGNDDGYYWVAMEYVPGTDLSRVLEKGALSEERALGIAGQVCRMLEVCHGHEVPATAEGGGTKGVVHGDIKPENLRLQDGDVVRVLDFGIAKPLSGTSTRNLFGSSMYRPPEYLESGKVDRQADLWALGVVLYLMVSGQRPFVGRNDEDLDTRIRSGEPPRRLPEESCSPRLRKVIYRCLRFEARERYGSARELCRDLEDVAAGRPLSWEKPGDPLDSTEVLRLSGRPARREDRGGGDPNATRRTHPVSNLGSADTGPFASLRPEPSVPPPPPPGAPAGGSSLSSPEGEGRRYGRGCLLFALGLGLVLAWLAFSEARTWRRGAEMERELTTDVWPDVAAIWQRYQEARRGCVLCLGLARVSGKLEEELVRTADRTIGSYRADDPVTREGDWRRAYEYLQAAVELGGGAKSRARMLYCRGQLDRIEAQREQGDARRRSYSDAISAFEEAAARNEKWPDPYLGLAWIHAYGMRDIDKLRAALAALEKRDYRLGRREKAMLADACWKQGLDLQKQAAALAGGEQEKERLGKARELLAEAVDLYGEILGFAAARTNRDKARASLDAVDDRLWQLEHPEDFGSPGGSEALSTDPLLSDAGTDPGAPG